MEPNEHIEKYPEGVATTPQENPSRRSSVFDSLMTSCRRPCVPFSQVLLNCRPPFGSLGRSFSLEEVAITPQENPSRRSSVFGSLMTSCRRLCVPFSQVLLICRPPFGSLGRSFSWFNGWSLPSLRCSSLSVIFSCSIFSCFQSLPNKIGKIVIIVCGLSCASLVVFSWPAINFFIRAHFMPFKIMIMNVRIVHRLLLYIS